MLMCLSVCVFVCLFVFFFRIIIFNEFSPCTAVSCNSRSEIQKREYQYCIEHFVKNIAHFEIKR